MQKGWYTAFDEEVAPSQATEAEARGVIHSVARWLWPVLLIASITLYFAQLLSA